MTRYTDKDGGVWFDNETVSRLVKIAEDVQSGSVPLVSVSDLSREELIEYLSGNPSAEILEKLRPVDIGDLLG